MSPSAMPDWVSFGPEPTTFVESDLQSPQPSLHDDGPDVVRKTCPGCFINIDTLVEPRIRLSNSRGRSPLRGAFAERKILCFVTVGTRGKDLSFAGELGRQDQRPEKSEWAHV